MTASPVRRVALALVVYLLVAWLVSGVAGWLREGLALPPLFGKLLVGLLAVGALAAVAVAWRYPRMGPWGAPGGPAEDEEPGRSGDADPR